MKLVNIPTYISVDVINYINGTLKTTNEDDFEEETFNEWLIIKDIEHKNNPSAYLRSCFKKELEKGTFKPKAKVDYIPNTQVLINAMRDKGICVMSNDSVWLAVVWEYLINFKEIDFKECQELNHKILAYMNENKSFEEYKKLLMNSNSLKKYDINWALLEEKAKQEILGWDKYLESLESEE